MPPRVALEMAVLVAAVSCSAGPPSDGSPRPDVARAEAVAAASAVGSAAPASSAADPMEAAPDPEAQRLFRARIAEAALPLVPGRAPPITSMALENTARGEARGMKADGEPQVATLHEGQRATRHVTIAKGACVTYLAEGGLGVIEVDLFLTVGDGAALRVITEDRHGGPIGVIGGRDGCFKNETAGPIEAELHVTARRGAGVILVQSFTQ